MPNHRPLHLFAAGLIDPAAGTELRGGVVVIDGLIADVGPHLLAASSGPADAQTIDCRGRALAPGLVDLRAFVGEPGAEYRETFKSASAAAAAGGVTTLVMRPDTDPPVDDPAIVDFILRRAASAARVRILPSAAITKGLAGREMTEFGLLQEAGAAFLSDGPHSIRNAQVMRRVMTYARMFDQLIVHHCEDRDLVGDGVMNEGEFATRLGLLGIPAAAETIVLERDLRLVRLTGARYHAALVSCRASIEAIRRAKDEGLPVTCGVSINNLTLNENDVADYRTFLKLTPPLRDEEERLALVEAVADGVIDVIVSDHDPQDVEVKRQPFAEAATGAIGLETLLAATLRLVHAGALSLSRAFEAVSLRPARLIGSSAGRLARDAPADLVIFDPDEPFVVDPALLLSICKNTPFEAARMQGVVHATFVGGVLVGGDVTPRP